MGSRSKRGRTPFLRPNAESPSNDCLHKRVASLFSRESQPQPGSPREVLIQELEAVGLTPDTVKEGSEVFRYGTAGEVLDHLLKSGAGTAFYEAIDDARRGQLTREFLEMLAARHEGKGPIEVVHEYVACIACKPDRT